MLQQKDTKMGAIVRYTIIVIVLVAVLFPIAWLILTSFKAEADIRVSPPHFLFKPTLDNYIYDFQKANFLSFIANTLLDAGVSTVFVIVLSSLAAYSFARYNPGGGNILFFILTTKMFPAIAVVLPYFLIFKQIGDTAIGKFLQIGLDKPGALIISYTMFNLPFAIWLMVSFFQDIPRELEDSARLDGYNRLQVLRRVVLPLATPGIAVTAIFCLIFSWNEFLFAYVLTRTTARTITVGVESFWTLRGILWGPVAAAATISVVPMLIFVLILQRYMVRGLTFGAVRG